MRAAGFEPTNKKQLLLDEKYIMRYILLSKKSNNTYTIVKSDITVLPLNINCKHDYHPGGIGHKSV